MQQGMIAPHSITLFTTPLDVCGIRGALHQIACFYSGGLLGGISVFAYDNFNPNILDETLRPRTTIKLPSRFIVIAEPPASIIVIDTENTPSVIWCDATDVEGLQNLSFVTPSQTWNTFSKFFMGLIEDEEDERGE